MSSQRGAGAIDFAGAWRAWLEGAGDPRLDPIADLAYWENAASEADGWPTQSCAVTLATVAANVGAMDTVLDVGAGTGRFALPLARQCRAVTLLDHSPAMLAVASAKAAAAGISNVSFVEATWEEADVEPHDVVLTAWSLYRVLDIEGALQRMIAATRRTLLVLAPDADPAQEARGETAGYLYILGALRDLGARASLEFVWEPQPDGPAVAVPLVRWSRSSEGGG